ncbi:unnamed protein product [Parnassius apollo]|uniref:(apollo) hypothetical protein n=1 Tax=Parnassius apollo TaxID=110799 RepID=A0A8S3XZ71_PARAO|nr:unnamed protein product [Parnassius apollo]
MPMIVRTVRMAFAGTKVSLSQPDIMQKLTERIDDLKQRIAAWEKWIQRYTERSTRFNQNRLFQSDQKRLYKSLERPMINQNLLMISEKDQRIGTVHFMRKNCKIMAPHTGSATPEQIDALLNFLDEHRDLACGRLRSLEGKVQAKRLWDELCNTLNSAVAFKHSSSGKRYGLIENIWPKKAAADSRRSASMTGGGPSVAPQLSHSELKVLSIMGDGFGDRQIGARVPAFTETNESRPSTYSQGSQLQQ